MEKLLISISALHVSWLPQITAILLEQFNNCLVLFMEDMANGLVLFPKSNTSILL